jgi:HSP20 family protein
MPMDRRLSRTGFAYPIDEFRDELDRLWNSLTASPPLQGWAARQGSALFPAGSALFPAVNVSETDDCITVEAELPGLDAGDVDIAATGEELVLKGTRPEPHLPAETDDGPGNGERRKAVTWHRRERGTGSFERRLTLPAAVDSARVEAKLVDGVLTITCPKAPERQPHKVAVHAN